MTENPYPDVIGYITGGDRINVGVVQAVPGVRPRTPPAGRPFEVALVVQNASDSKVDVTVILHLPKQFTARSQRLVIGLAPAEVGYVSLPVTPSRDSASNSVYKIGVEVDAKPQEKPNRVRDTGGGTPFDPSTLSEDRLKRLEALRRASFSTSKRIGLGRTIIDLPVQVGAPVETGAQSDPKPGWVSLWTMADLSDDAALLGRFADIFRHKVLPQLKRDSTVAPLVEETTRRFEQAGFALQPPEAVMIAKMMALILEYAAPSENRHDPLQAGIYNLTPALTGSKTVETMPRWSQAMLRLIARDERAIGHAVAAIIRLLYIELLRDAIDHAFTLVEINTGEDVGTDAEKEAYALHLLQMLQEDQQLDFVHVYMPLVLAGITINDRLTPSDENFVEHLRELWSLLDQRRLEGDENSQPVIEIAEQVIERALETYGYRRGST